MSIKDKLKKMAHFGAPLMTMATLQAAELPTSEEILTPQDMPKIQVSRPIDPKANKVSPADLDSRVKQGMIINGETQADRDVRWQEYKNKNGRSATVDAIGQEKLTSVEIAQKNKDGYLISDIIKGNSTSYYLNGVVQSRQLAGTQKAETFYPNGSKKMVREADGTETSYYEGPENGVGKIQKTPHRINEAFDVLDTDGNRIEHWHTVQNSGLEGYKGDVQTVDLYNPETGLIAGSYTMDHYAGEYGGGQLARVAVADDQNKMHSIKLNRQKEVYFVEQDMDINSVREVYQEEQQKQLMTQLTQKKGQNAR